MPIDSWTVWSLVDRKHVRDNLSLSKNPQFYPKEKATEIAKRFIKATTGATPDNVILQRR